MRYTITYYNNAVEQALLALPAHMQARYIHLSSRMHEYGAHLGEPHTKAIGNGLFELRLKSAEGIARVFYCTLIGQRIVMLHCFVKKSQKIPLRELHLAETRMKEIKNET